MKISKITSCLISLLLVGACGQKESEKKITHSVSTPVEAFESLLPDFHYYTDGASTLKIEASGFIHSTKVNKKLLVHPDTNKCKYYEDVINPIKIQFQSLDIKKYFDFYVDDVQLNSVIEVNTALIVVLPKNSYKLEMKLKPHLRGEQNLRRYEAVKRKYCLGSARVMNYRLPIIKYEEFSKIEKLKDIKFQIKLTKSFLP